LGAFLSVFMLGGQSSNHAARPDASALVRR
jgi:hypothetical protein